MTEDELKAFCSGSGVDYAAGEHEGKVGYWLHWVPHTREDDGECSFVAMEALAGLEWGQVWRFVVNGRNVRQQMRVVGYLSNVKNWNASKIAELRDRQAGDYGVGRMPKGLEVPADA